MLCFSITNIYGDNLMKKIDLSELLQKDNPGKMFEIKSKWDDKEPGMFELVFISGEVSDVSVLTSFKIKKLTLKNTKLTNLRFLESSLLKENLSQLILIKNSELKDFTSLEKLNVRTLVIIKQFDFTDASSLNESVKEICLEKTGIKTINFKFPNVITSLSLMWNEKLHDSSQVSSMQSIESLYLSDPGGIDFSKLEKMRYFALIESKADMFPQLPENEFEQITIFSCPNLISIDSLQGKKVKQFNLLPSGNHLKRYLETLKNMEIEELIVTDHEVEEPDELKNLSSHFKKYQFN